MEKPILYFDETVELAKMGCQKSMTKIWNDNVGLARHLSKTFVSSKSEMDEVVCIGMAKAFKCLHQWNGSGPFQGWLRTVLRRTYINHCRERMSRLEKRPTISSGEIEMYDTVAESSEHGDFIAAAKIMEGVKTLCRSHRRTFELVGIQQYTYEQAAAELGTTPGTIKANMFDARQKLKRYCIDNGLVEA
jgi:RNA polymerase sigma-70 factor (ECF subfamily)